MQRGPELHEAHRRTWGDEGVLARFGRNFGWLAGSTGFSAVASLIYVALTARSLGPRGFGSFALMLTYGELITNLAQFHSWKAVTSFGAAHLQNANRGRLDRLFGFTAAVDLLGGIIGAVVGVGGVLLIGPYLGWTAADEHTAAWFGAALMLTSGTTPAGMLRLFDRFDLQVYSETVAQITRLTGCLAGWALGASISWYLLVWALAALLQLACQWAAILLLGHRLHFGYRAFRLASLENRGVWSFMLKTNANTSLSLVWMQCGTLIVGMKSGPIDAGGFRLAHRLSQAMVKPVEIATKALFPELARLVSQGDRVTVRRLLLRLSSIATAFAALAVIAAGLWGRDILRLIAGRHFEFAAPFLFLLSIAAAMNVAGFVLEPFHNAHFRVGTVLRSYAIAALLYFAVLLALPGAEAAAFASIAAAAAILLQLGASAGRILATVDDGSVLDAGSYRAKFISLQRRSGKVAAES